MTCHRCQTEAFKFGIQNGFQRYRCKTCGKTFSDIPARPLDDLRVDFEKACQVVHLLCEGMGVRAVERLTQLNRRTVLGILETAGRKCARLLDDRIKGVKVKDVEIDELYSFVNCLQQNTTVDDMARGDQYVFIGTEINSKLILHHLVGKREKSNAVLFMAGLKRKLAEGRFQLTSDAYTPYASELGAVFKVFRESIDYGTERKEYATLHPRIWQRVPRRFNPVVCVGVTRTPKIGNPDRNRMTTNHVERLNLSVRLFNRRFTRKTLGFSKTLRNHKLSVALMVAHFNFCRVHSAHKQTPAMAAGLTNHAWSIKELLYYDRTTETTC
jgi:transposase-like protein/IS1 family transposase